MPASRTRIVAVALALTGCLTPRTRLVSSWTAPDALPFRFKKVMAIAFVKTEARRHLIEDRICAEIARLGTRTEAVPSYTLISSGDLRDEGLVKSRVEAAGFDGAVAWRAAGTDRETYYVPGAVLGAPFGYRRFWGFYPLGLEAVYEPGYLATERVVHIETLVYRVGPASDELVWAGNSETVDPASIDGLIDGVSRAVSDELQRKGLLDPR